MTFILLFIDKINKCYMDCVETQLQPTIHIPVGRVLVGFVLVFLLLFFRRGPIRLNGEVK